MAMVEEELDMNNEYEKIKEIKERALNDEVPIMNDEGIDFLTTFVIKKQIKNVLEIGTGVGYSAIMMAVANKNLKITTIERDETRYLEAIKNIKKMNLEDRITLIFKDALDVKLDDKYDLIFIDAAKGKNIDFFQNYERNLLDNGYIITDNMGFHGYVEMDENEIKSDNIRGIVRKIKEYIHFLENHLKYKTSFYKIGDGIAVTEKRM
jgi:predicted O-methyltransferase YrrM